MSQFETIEPEVLPPEDDQPKQPKPEEPRRGRGKGAGLFAGLLLDAADAITVYPWMGMLVGAAVGLYLCIDLKLPPSKWGWVMAGAGIYCGLPFTRLVPLGTMVMLSRSFLEQWNERNAP